MQEANFLLLYGGVPVMCHHDDFENAINASEMRFCFWLSNHLKQCSMIKT